MNTNFLTRLTNRTLGAAASIRPQPAALGVGRAAEPTDLDGGPLADAVAVRPPAIAATSAPHAAPTPIAFADDAPAILPQPAPPMVTLSNRVFAPAPSEAQEAAPADAPAHTGTLLATLAQSALPLFSSLVTPSPGAAHNNAPRQDPRQTPAAAPAPPAARLVVASPAPQAGPAGSAEPPGAPPLLPERQNPRLTNSQPAATRKLPVVSATAAASAPDLAPAITPLGQGERDSRWPAVGSDAPQLPAAPLLGETDGNPRRTALVPASRADASPPRQGIADPAHPPPRPTIQVTIGRVEVRALHPPPAAGPKATRPHPALSLDAYLQQRKGGRS